MIRLEVEACKVFGFHEDCAGVSRSLVEHVTVNGLADISPVPVFRVPELPELIGGPLEHDYLLIDGNHRKNVALYLGHPLSIVVYENDEEIDYQRDGLAYSRHLRDSKRYETILLIYLAKVHSLRPLLLD